MNEFLLVLLFTVALLAGSLVLVVAGYRRRLPRWVMAGVLCGGLGLVGIGGISTDCMTVFLLVLPFTLALLVGGVLVVTGYRRKSTGRVVAGVLCGGLGLVVLGGMGWAVATVDWAFREHTNPRLYARALRDWPGSPLVAHFPAAIPAEATHVRFYYTQGGMQGDKIIQLRYRTSPAQAQALYARFTRQPHEVIRRDDPASTALEFNTSDALPEPGFRHTGVFPPDYEILRLPAGYCGVAFSRPRQEIVYWAVATRGVG